MQVCSVPLLWPNFVVSCLKEYFCLSYDFRYEAIKFGGRGGSRRFLKWAGWPTSVAKGGLPPGVDLKFAAPLRFLSTHPINF